MRSLQALGLFILATVVATVSGYRLSISEDRIRSEQCGRVMQSKILNGTIHHGRDIPWLVQIRHPRYGHKALKYHSGFMISERHVVTVSDVLLDYNHGSNTIQQTFNWMRNKTAPGPDMKTCVDRALKVPEFVLQNITVHSCVGVSFGDNCQKETPLPIVSAHYIGNCNTSKISYGLTVLELATPIKSVTPVCVPNHRIDRFGDEVEVFGTGWNSEKNTTSVISSSKTQLAKCRNDQGQSDLSICTADTNSCWWDDGGPIQKTVNGQKYAIGAIWSRACLTTSNKQVSVAALSSQICKVTGVCQSPLERTTTTTTTTTRKPTTTTTAAAKSKSRLVISKHFVLTKIAE